MTAPPGNVSPAESMSSLAADERKALLETLSEADAEEILHDWTFWARPSQLPPDGTWRVWLLLAGRGFGKTRTGAEWVRAEAQSGRRGRLALVAPTAADARDVMVEGESGLLAIAPRGNRPEYEPSKRRLTWHNGAMATLYSADEPDRLRGPQHDGAWLDELAAWRFPETFDQLQFGLRLGSDPRIVVTTTPRPTQLIKQLVERPTTFTTTGTTYENVANLAPAFVDSIISRYQGTRLGLQEIEARILGDPDGALWKRDWIQTAVAPDLIRVVIGIDPAGSSSEQADETGIIIAGKGVDGNGYVLADRSCRLSPEGWASRAVAGFDQFSADRVVAEANFGGEMVQSVLRTVRSTLPFTAVHASRGKGIRAEPISSLYEQKRIFHCDAFPELEDQLCSWTPDSGKSPDRLDALVWALTWLMLEKPLPRFRVLA